MPHKGDILPHRCCIYSVPAVFAPEGNSKRPINDRRSEGDSYAATVCRLFAFSFEAILPTFKAD